MDEARRFLRYATPGLAFAVQGAGILLIIDPAWTLRVLGELKDDAGGGAAISLFLASGGLGYLCSVVHHVVHQYLPGASIDHGGAIQRLRKANVLQIRALMPDGSQREARDQLDRTAAWVVLTAVWHERLQKEGPIQVADHGASSFTDLVHAAGAHRFAAAAALVAALYIAAIHPGPKVPAPSQCSLGFAIVAGGLLVALHQVNYVRLGLLAQSFIEEVFTDALVREALAPVPEAQGPRGPLVTLLEPKLAGAA